ncbi:MAG TPA: histone deacetylase family protein [Candidatus Acidoferrum sp.]|nr:histone deacetylase family protein [Candidatus Acidoferrum sp.]
MTTLIYYHDECLLHDPGQGHPECAERLQAILAALRTSSFGDQLQWLDAPLGTRQQALLAHNEALWDEVTAAAPASGRHALDPDTVMSPGSLGAALRGVGAACAGIDVLLHGDINHVFCLTRPPGHHATRKRSMGFCIFNQVAIAALHAMKQYNIERIAIVDFDVHHGNGTQDIILGKPGLLYLSTHQYPHYPGSGSQQENLGGNIHNVPLARETEDTQYQRVFSREVLPELHAFAPQLLLVSAGFDAHRQDPLAGLLLTEATYHWLGMQLRAIADKHCHGRLLSVLEGGYNLDVLGSSVAAYCEGALGKS